MTKPISEPFREVSAAIIVGTCGRYLFQQRDDIPGLLYAGMIGLFGGHREGTESHLQCLQRELHEELGVELEPDRCEHLVSFSVRYAGSGGVKGEYYVVRGLPIERLTVTEGAPHIVRPEDMPALLHRMTPSTCYATRLFLEQIRTAK